MTKEDIKKALEACGAINSPCVDCPYKNVEDCYDTLNNDALKLITEQENEIEDLKDEIIYLERKIAIRDNVLKDRDKAIEMLEGKQDTIVKQAQIDILTELKKKYGFYICCSWCRATKLLGEIIDEFIDEIKK